MNKKVNEKSTKSIKDKNPKKINKVEKKEGVNKKTKFKEKLCKDFITFASHLCNNTTFVYYFISSMMVFIPFIFSLATARSNGFTLSLRTAT